MLTRIALLSLVTLGVHAQIPAAATNAQLSLVDAEYVNSGFAFKDLRGFGVDLDATSLLTIRYPFGIVENGAAYTVAQVATLPTVYVTPTVAGLINYEAPYNFTLMLADAASLGDPDTQGNYRHFLVNNLQGPASISSSNTTFIPTGGVTITAYAAPGPLAGSGPHRYAWLLFAEALSGFTAPAGLTDLTASGHWNVSTYVAETDLTLVAASFFTVENGRPTGSVVETSAVNTGSTSSSTTSTTGRVGSTTTGTTTSSSSATSSSSSPAPTETKTGGASAVKAASLLLGLVGAITLLV